MRLSRTTERLHHSHIMIPLVHLYEGVRNEEMFKIMECFLALLYIIECIMCAERVACIGEMRNGYNIFSKKI